MLSKNINFKAFNHKPINKKLKKYLSAILNKNNEIFKSLTPNYKYHYSKNLIKKVPTYLIQCAICQIHAAAFNLPLFPLGPYHISTSPRL